MAYNQTNNQFRQRGQAHSSKELATLLLYGGQKLTLSEFKILDTYLSRIDNT